MARESKPPSLSPATERESRATRAGRLRGVLAVELRKGVVAPGFDAQKGLLCLLDPFQTLISAHLKPIERSKQGAAAGRCPARPGRWPQRLRRALQAIHPRRPGCEGCSFWATRGSGQRKRKSMPQPPGEAMSFPKACMHGTNGLDRSRSAAESQRLLCPCGSHRPHRLGRG